ncbi:MAG: Yip1 family protein, partial [Oscillospiraceae bacterium]
KGTQLGTFITPISIAVNGEDIVAIDFVNNNMTVFRISDFGRQFKTAQSLTLAGEYEEAKPYWESVNGSDKNCQLAYIGLAKAALSEKNYEAAMSYAKSGLDQSTYAQAYKFVRNDFISHNFWWMVCVAVLIVAAFFIFKHYKKKKNLEFHINERLKTCLGTLLRPVETFNCVKYKGGGSVALATACLALFYLATVSVKLLGGFMFNLVDVSSFNAIYTLLGTVGVVLLYVLVNWAVCILFEGKGRLREIYCVTCYSLQPLMLYSILFVVMSYVIIPSSNSGFGIAQVFFTGMFIIWMLISITIVHEFSFFKAIGMGLVIILGMGIAAFIVFIMLTLGQDLIGFLIGIFKEVTLR